MKKVKDSLLAAVLGLVLWGAASVLVGGMGPIQAYDDATRLFFRGEASEAFRTLFYPAWMFLYGIGMIYIVGLAGMVLHFGGLVMAAYHAVPDGTEEERHHGRRERHHYAERRPPIRQW